MPRVKRFGRVNVEKASIDDLASQVGKIWGRRDTKRPPLVQWLGVVDHTSRLVEFVRKSKWDQVVIEIGEVFVWWLSFMNRLAQEPSDTDALELTNAVLFLPGKVSDIVWSKYPGVCPVCFGLEVARRAGVSIEENQEEKPAIPGVSTLVAAHEAMIREGSCRCLSRNDAIENRPQWFKDYTKEAISGVIPSIRDQKPTTLNELENMFKRLFSSKYDIMSVVEVALHLQEEVGEIANAMLRLHCQPHKDSSKSEDLEEYRAERSIRMRSLAEELADVFSWLVATRESTQRIIQTGLHFTRELARRETDRKQEEPNPLLTPDAVENVVRLALSPASTLLDLTLHIFNYNGKLSCDKCKKPECDMTDDEHLDTNGMLFGDTVRGFFEVIANSEPVA
ncbi:MAG: hypothetical protein E4H08_10080 [Candidatus Atribacteria bacterium]|nr:MAG: hypothetical protein E4H08_10080 [Candidatus Atribacteria bacterium]